MFRKSKLCSINSWVLEFRSGGTNKVLSVSVCVWEREQILGVFGSSDVFLIVFFNKYIIKIIYFYIF
jgi:hypothetical protein